METGQIRGKINGGKLSEMFPAVSRLTRPLLKGVNTAMIIASGLQLERDEAQSMLTGIMSASCQMFLMPCFLKHYSLVEDAIINHAHIQSGAYTVRE